jgi:hypothetical protein
MKMIVKLVLLIILTISGVVLSSCNDSAGDIVFKDNFERQYRGPLSTHLGAHTEYHYLPVAAPKGNWAVSNYRGWWSIHKSNEKSYLYQSKIDKAIYTHPMVVAGDALWKDYQLSVTFTPESNDYQSGIVFRYQNDRCYYFFGIDKAKVVLKMVNHAIGFHEPNEKILSQADFSWKPETQLTAIVSISGDLIQAELEGIIKLEARDSTFKKGKIGLTSNIPTRFHEITVSMSKSDKQSFTKARTSFDQLEKDLQEQNPKPVLWKKINTKGFGVGRNLRFGDLNNDGETDVLIGQVLHHGPKDRNSELSCLTAMTFDGEILWQIGQPDLWKDFLTNDVGFQIHDIDRDGRNEVVYCMGLELIVAEGATGKTKYKIPTPETPGGKPFKKVYNKFSRILGDCLYFCDLRGRGYDSDIIIKDRYRNLWAYTDKLKLLWKAECNTGHYPFAYDMDEDGKDELLIGYTLFDDTGTKIWTLDDKIKDHADGVAIVRFNRGEDLKILCAASDEGMIFIDLKGNILQHHYIGHVQNPAVANFRDDLPGLETVSINFWKNQGIIHFFNSGGDIYYSFEPNQFGSMCLPINWTGRSEEFFVHNPNVDEGGMFDGWGRKVVIFPDDGHPDMCNAVMNITGDCRDEVVVWDPYQIWVYTQDDNPISGKLYMPERNPLYNYSNYQATVSLPGYSE